MAGPNLATGQYISPALQQKIDPILYSDLENWIGRYLGKKSPKPVTINVQQPEAEVKGIALIEPEGLVGDPTCGQTQTAPCQQEILCLS